MLSHKFNRSINVIKLALETFQRLGMLSIEEQGIYLLNWGKHQDLDKLEKIKEQTRQRVATYRANKKLLLN